MYLLMLLATFMASIYGYNLSARPDYDRDIAYKKAVSVLFKFSMQERAMRQIFVDIFQGGFVTGDGNTVPFALPGDMLYADASSSKARDNELIHTFLHQDGSEAQIIYLRRKDRKGSNNPHSKNYIRSDMEIYNGDEMATKLLCVTKPLNESGTDYCVSATDTDADGNTYYTSSCCTGGASESYLISYKKLDPRWVNRVTGDVSLDFFRALADREYHDNTGVIRWTKSPETNKEAWVFRGKISFLPVYADEMAEWNEQYQNMVNYPAERRNRAMWTLPDFFDKHFFKSLDGEEICNENQPCLMRIQNI